VRYLARSVNGSQLYGKNAFEAGLIDQWLDFSSSEVELASVAWLFPIQGIIPNNPLATKKAQDDIKKILTIFDSHLLTRTFFVGNSITLADIVLGTSLVQLYQLVLDPAFRGQFVNVNRWFVTLVNQPEFKAVLGEVHLAEKAAVAAAKEKAPKEKKEKPVKQEQPKKKEKEQPKEEPADDEEEGEPEAPKKTNPLDLLPKSTLVLDEWKRKYMNTDDTRGVSVPWLFENFDANGYCLYWCDYILVEPFKFLFNAANLIGGFFQRLETLHKYAFGSMIIFGEQPVFEGDQIVSGADDPLTVSGVWLFRGTEVPADMKDCEDFAVYNWRPVNLADAEEKKLFEDYLSWSGEFRSAQYPKGRKFVQGKTYV